ncbi:hypothetical protein [Tabrizicola sp. YIM 78059]|uniref:hypothetical protein n=1 Tax=Tabrizicola sp. YIM 78059 TaxID=2529861 RepID=UPI0010AADF28|nr:hypothetical protein [Tabrizicola sp. YIM 78059]
MSISPKLLTRSFAVGILVVSNSQGATALTVTRCNALSDGVYRPVLVVEHDGVRTIHAMGEDGLTRSIIFNPEAALSWAKARYGADATLPAVYADGCGSGGGGGAPAAIGDDDDDYEDDDDDDDDDGGTGF